MKFQLTNWLVFFTLSLTIALGGSAEVQLSSPANNAVISTTSVTLIWQKYESYTTYYGELIREPLYENEAIYSTIKGTSQTISGLIMDGSTYCWRIGISSNLTSSSWSNYRFFRCATTVPYVVSMDRIEAAEKIITNKLQLGTETVEYDNVVPINRVIRQEPAASTVVDPETKVNLFISKGPIPYVSVPSLIGMTLLEAQAALDSIGLLLGTVAIENDDVIPGGRVLSHSPAFGMSVIFGSYVDLVLSDGPVLVSVPDLANLTSTEARSVLLDTGLVLGVIAEQYSDTVPLGKVISQLPKAYATVTPGTSVSIVISKGKAPVQNEGEGESSIEGEGEVLTEGEGETSSEGEGEDVETGTTCTGCTGAKSLNGFVGDWLLVGIALMGLAATKHF